MVYVGRSPSSLPELAGNPFIDPDLLVDGEGNDLSGRSMTYWPNYSDIPPKARATYLDWLANGRSDTGYSIGYVFLYFYGLEHRFFMDDPDESEKQDIVNEVQRLLSIYGNNKSVRTYLGIFLDIAGTDAGTISLPKPDTAPPVYDVPFSMKIAIGRMVRERIPINAQWALSWYRSHPERTLKTPAKRATPEFQALFEILFHKKHPRGISIIAPKQQLRAKYRAASGAFEKDLQAFTGRIPDISLMPGILDIIHSTVEEATNRLREYSRLLARNPQHRDTIQAHLLLPEELRSTFPSAELEGLRAWAQDAINSGDTVPVEDLMEKFAGSPPDRISKRSLTGAAEALAQVSIGLAPDPRHSLRHPKPGEPVILFNLPESAATPDKVSDKYRALLVALAIGALVANVDGAVTPVERERLDSMITASKLSITEQKRLHANLKWMTTVRTDIPALRHHLRNIPEDASRELSRIALAMAASDGAVHAEEVRALEDLYNAIGLDRETIYSSVHQLAASVDPVLIRAAENKEQGFKIPGPDEKETGVSIDPERVADIMADTARISSILAGIFNSDEPEEEVEESGDTDTDASVLPGLNPKEAAFLEELLRQEHWEEAQCQTLASQFQLMLSGTLETLNEWAFDRYSDMLVETYNGYQINQDVATKIKQEA